MPRLVPPPAQDVGAFVEGPNAVKAIVPLALVPELCDRVAVIALAPTGVPMVPDEPSRV